MINAEQMTNQETKLAALRVLARELGPVGYVRFLQQIAPGTGNYTEDRHAWLDGMSWEEITQGLDQAREELARIGLKVEVLEAPAEVVAGGG